MEMTNMQLDLFAPTQTGFKYRRRLYNDAGNYLYTALPHGTGYTLNAVSTMIQSIEMIDLTHSEYAAYLKTHGLVEVLPKDVKKRIERDGE